MYCNTCNNYRTDLFLFKSYSREKKFTWHFNISSCLLLVFKQIKNNYIKIYYDNNKLNGTYHCDLFICHAKKSLNALITVKWIQQSRCTAICKNNNNNNMNSRMHKIYVLLSALKMP